MRSIFLWLFADNRAISNPHPRVAIRVDVALYPPARPVAVAGAVTRAPTEKFVRPTAQFAVHR